MTAAELVAHLEAGGLVARAIHDPHSIMYLRFEIYATSSGTICRHFGVYGFGSAVCRPGDMLREVLEEPQRWVKVDAEPHETREARAQAELEKLGTWNEGHYKWELTVHDTRPLNNGSPTAGYNPVP